MPNPSWPASLPSAVEVGFEESPQPTAISSEMDAGPAKQRARFTKTWSKFKVSITCTTAQVATLQTFIYTTCKGGAIAFDWKHPRTGSALTLRFPAKMAIKYRAIATDRFQVEFEVEEVIA